MKLIQRLNTLLHLKRVFPREKTAAVILAGGMGSRMGSSTPKQLMQILGKPVFVHTVLAFDACRYIDEIVLVVRPEEEAAVRIMLSQHGIRKCRAVVVGGQTRQESAANGFAALSGECSFVAIHDVARCLITLAQIRDVVLAAHAYGAATAASRATDTVKVANKNGFISETVPRETVWLAATPQVMRQEYYALALRMAEKKKVAVTDDNSLMELIGQRVRLVDTGSENLKITHPQDLVHAEIILKNRQEARK